MSSIKTKKVSDIMSRNLKVVHPDQNLADARALMIEHNIRHVLVTERVSMQLVGIVSDRDVRKLLSPFVGTEHASPRDEATFHIKVGGMMHSDVVVAAPSDPLKSIVTLILQKKINCVPVVKPGRVPVGVVTTDDLLRVLLAVL